MKKYYLDLISFEKKHRKELQRKYPTAKTMVPPHPTGGEFPYDCYVVMVAWESNIRPQKGIEMHNVCNVFYDRKGIFDMLFQSYITSPIGNPNASRFELACKSLVQVAEGFDKMTNEQKRHLQNIKNSQN